MHDTVRKQRLSDDFKKRVGELRQHRNTAFHSVSKSLTVEASQVLLAVFEAVENLNNGKRWLEIHKDFLENSPISLLTCLEHEVRSQMMIEMEILIEQFTPEDIEKYTGFRVQESSYRCPLCEYAARKRGGKPNFAQIIADDIGNTKSLYCFCCCENLEAIEDIEIIKVKCQDPNCDSTFVGIDGVCLLCGYENELDD